MMLPVLADSLLLLLPRTTESITHDVVHEPPQSQNSDTLFSTQPETNNSASVQQPQQLGRPADTVRNVDSISGIQSSLRNVNIRSDSFSNTNQDEDDAAMDKVSTTLRAQPTVSRRSRGRRSVLGTPQDGSAQTVARDVLGSPLPQASEPVFPSAPLATPVLIPSNGQSANAGAAIGSGTGAMFGAGPLLDRRHTASSMSYDGTESVRSNRSNTSTAPSLKHIEPQSDGFHLSVIETVSVLVGQNNAVSNLNISGEAAVSIKNPNDYTPIQLQIQSPDTISRLVANTHVLSTTGDRVYQLQAEAASNMITLFKYRVEPEQSRHSRYMPILISQQWSTEENQTSVKLSYRLNPLFGAGSLSLQDVEVSVSINGQANSCVAKPSGTFIKRSSRLIWRLNELTLESGKEGALLARFKTSISSPPTDAIEIKFKTTSSNIARGSGFGVHATRAKDNPFADSPTIENVLVQSAYVLQSGNFLASTATS